jgi:hypothetical protein
MVNIKAKFSKKKLFLQIIKFLLPSGLSLPIRSNKVSPVYKEFYDIEDKNNYKIKLKNDDNSTLLFFRQII